MKADTRDMISITDANNTGLSALITRAENGRPQVLIRNSRPVAAVVNTEIMDRLEELEEMEEDLRLKAIAIARMVTDNGVRLALDDVLAELGVDLDED